MSQPPREPPLSAVAGDEPVLLEMEAEAARRDFPIVGRHVGITLEVLARAIGAARVLELGSGFGYSAYWFSRAVGAGGELHLTDTDPDNLRRAEEYLGRAGLGQPVHTHVGDALETLERLTGEFDVVFSDIDKDDYPRAWRAAAGRIRTGGLYLCDNVLGWGGARVYEQEGEGRTAERIRAVREHNRSVLQDEHFIATILPIRYGVMTALRLVPPASSSRDGRGRPGTA
ncbi:O-methyltransferase [soil metagenome]